MRIKLLGSETEVANTVPDDIDNAAVVRVYAPTDAVVIVRDSEGTEIGSMTVPQGVIELVEKSPSDTIESSVAVKCVSVAFR